MATIEDARASLVPRPYKLVEAKPPNGSTLVFRGHLRLEKDADAARTPEPEEEEFAGTFNNFMGALAALNIDLPAAEDVDPVAWETAKPPAGGGAQAASDGNAGPPSGTRPANQETHPPASCRKLEAREEFAEKLQDIAQRFIQGQPLARVWADYARVQGRQEERWEAIAEGAKRSVKVTHDDEGYVTNLHMDLGDGHLTPDQSKLVVEVRRALTVVGVVFARPEAPSTPLSKLAERWFGAQTLTLDKRRRHASYVCKLYDIASCGLRPGRGASVALRSLDGLREDFVAREADGVKCQHARLLGARALAIALPLLLAYTVFGPILSLSWANFFLLAAGACFGTWLSFSLRRPTLQFDDLLLQGEDRANPMARILVVVGLAIAVGLLLHTGLVKVAFGDVSLGVDEGAKAILLGLLCGIAEMALAGAIASRANDIAGRFAGGPPAEVVTVQPPSKPLNGRSGS